MALLGHGPERELRLVLHDPGQYAARLERQVREALFTDAAREIGARDLAQSRAILQADLLA